MPKHDSKLKAQIRAHMERTGLPYAAAAAAVEKTAADRQRRDLEDGGLDRLVPFRDVKRRLDEADAVIRQEGEQERTEGVHDPYRRAQAFFARSMAWLELARHAEGTEYHAACMLASFHDQHTAAALRFEYSIPTLFPQTMAAHAGLQCCEWCGRPWQADSEGACERCPRLMWGPTPRSADEAQARPAPVPVRREQLRSEPLYDD